MRDRRSLLHLPFNILRITLLLGSGGLSVLLVFAFLQLWQVGWQMVQGLGGWLRVENQAPQIDVPLLVVQQIRGVSELTTTVFAMEAIVPTSQDRQWGDVLIGRTQLLYIGYGEVRAGIDLSQMEPDDVKISGDHLIVTLPAPQILDKKIDVERSQVYDYDRGFLSLGPDTAPELQTFAQRQTLDKILLSACEQGILRKANEQAELTLSRLLSQTWGNAEYTSIEIETTPPQMCGQDQPSAPAQN